MTDERDRAARACREARRSLAALLDVLPEERWREHKGVFENAVEALVEEVAALRAERDAACSQALEACRRAVVRMYPWSELRDHTVEQMRAAVAAGEADTTQSVIVAALRTAGASVWLTHTAGHGAPDLVVGWGERVLILVEAKSAGGDLTPDEKRWHEDWRGPRVEVVRGPEEAVAVLRRHIGDGGRV